MIRRGVEYFGSQAALAKAIDYSQQAVSDWLNGHRPVPLEAAKKIEVMTDGFAKVPPIVIDKNIPIPTDRAKQTSYKNFPFSTMKVGDSFLVTDDHDKKYIAVTACRYGKNSGKLFCTRKVAEGVRVWRVE